MYCLVFENLPPPPRGARIRSKAKQAPGEHTSSSTHPTRSSSAATPPPPPKTTLLATTTARVRKTARCLDPDARSSRVARAHTHIHIHVFIFGFRQQSTKSPGTCSKQVGKDEDANHDYQQAAAAAAATTTITTFDGGGDDDDDDDNNDSHDRQHPPLCLPVFGARCSRLAP